MYPVFSGASVIFFRYLVVIPDGVRWNLSGKKTEKAPSVLLNRHHKTLDIK